MTKEEKEKLYFYQVMDEFNKEFDYDKELEQKRLAEVRTAHADGLEEGITRGISQGQYKEKRSVARNMIKMALPKETILKATGINAEEYDKLVTT